MAKKRLIYFNLYVLWEILLSLRGLFSLHVVRLKQTHHEGENIKTFVMSKPKRFNFEAGQYGLWFIPRMIWGKPVRLFTIAASPTEDTLQISTRISSTSFKQKLSALPLGSRVFMCGPLGKFTLGAQPPKEVVLVAGGIGVTPMRALSKFVHDTSAPVKVTLIHSADKFYLYQNQFKQNVPNCHFVTKATFAKTLEDVAKAAARDAVFYISGPPAFVVFAEAELRRHGKRRIKKDGFLGY